MSSPDFWLDEEGQYWVAVAEHPDREAAQLFAEDLSGDKMRFAGRLETWLRDCPVEHLCFGESNCHCDYHEEEVCQPEHLVDVWHFVSKDLPRGAYQ